MTEILNRFRLQAKETLNYLKTFTSSYKHAFESISIIKQIYK